MIQRTISMAGMFCNGIIINGVKYEAVKPSSACECVCDGCALRPLCDDSDFDPCALFGGEVNFRVRR